MDMTEATTKEFILIFSTILFAIYLVDNVRAANFTVDINATDPFFPGDIIKWIINVTNTGTLTLDPVEVVVIIPLGLTFNGSATPTQSSISNQTLIWNNIGPITIGSSNVVTFFTSVDLNDKPGNLTLYTNITATYNFKGLHNISQEIFTDIIIAQKPTFLTPTLSFNLEILLIISLVSISLWYLGKWDK